jgi:TrmH family RNA methyltransferase
MALSALPRLQPVAATHPAARRYSRARRNLLPRHDRGTAVSGRWAHDLLLETGAEVETFLWCPGERQLSSEVVDHAAAVAETAASAYVVSERTLARLHPGLSGPALLSVVRLPTWRPQEVVTADAQLFLVADGIEYAGNLGTLVRTADACGADGLVLTNADARITHPKVFVASRGTVLTLPVLEYADVRAARRDLSGAGFTVYVAEPAAALSYREGAYAFGRSAFVVGSEGDGVCAEWRTPDLTRVSIPMHGTADSLNVAASAAILLFEARGQLDRSDSAQPHTRQDSQTIPSLSASTYQSYSGSRPRL